MDILLLGSSLKSKLVACPLTQVPPATGDTWTHRCDIREQNVSECVRMTHWEGDCPFLIISPMFYVPNSSFVPHRKTEISTHCACGVTGFSWDTLLDIPFCIASKGDKRPTWSLIRKSANCEDMQCWYRLFDLWCSCSSNLLSQMMNQQKYLCQIL